MMNEGQEVTDGEEEEEEGQRSYLQGVKKRWSWQSGW